MAIPKARPQIKQEAGAASANEAKQEASVASASSEAKQEPSAAASAAAARGWGEVEEKRRSWKRWKESLEEESLEELEQP